MADALNEKTAQIEALMELEKRSEGINDKYLTALVAQLREENAVLKE